MSNIQAYAPDYYDGIYEYEQVIKSNDHAFDKSNGLLKMSFLNSFVTETDENGVSIFEDMYNITPSKNDSLETRKSNIILKMLPAKPITINYFKELISLLNIEATIDVNPNNFSVNIYGNTYKLDYSKTQNLLKILDGYLPVNLVYLINKLSESNSQSNFYVGTATSGTSYSESKVKTSFTNTSRMRRTNIGTNTQSLNYTEIKIKGGKNGNL
ncbi:DUF2313 domain-containing protein [Lactobacillus sp. S2-2]|uniref:putative phage tail protein n=1 Tax=Lactobacillus sp. S2-2 TaxID=2692917 RepID=UPI001F177246|nr:putative phage tail protein [Lactobacillus sp. S2-2]MCF6515547.1 DUF2313 domain-containing protein [Lactobacillus sp. S2-2]